MPRVRFLRDFPWKPKASVTIDYRSGMTLSVTRRCAAEAVAVGAAELIEAMRGSSTAKEAADAERQSEGAVVA